MLQGLDAAWKGALNYTVFRTNPTDSLNRPPRTQPFALSSTQSAKASAPARTRGRRADEKNDFIIKISQKAVLINRASRNIKQELSSYFLNLLVEKDGLHHDPHSEGRRCPAWSDNGWRPSVKLEVARSVDISHNRDSKDKADTML